MRSPAAGSGVKLRCQPRQPGAPQMQSNISPPQPPGSSWHVSVLHLGMCRRLLGSSSQTADRPDSCRVQAAFWSQAHVRWWMTARSLFCRCNSSKMRRLAWTRLTPSLMFRRAKMASVLCTAHTHGCLSLPADDSPGPTRCCRMHSNTCFQAAHLMVNLHVGICWSPSNDNNPHETHREHQSLPQRMGSIRLLACFQAHLQSIHLLV